jgi:hypothetical protein
MLAGLVIVPVVSLITKAPDKAVVEEAFSGYRRPGAAAEKTEINI